MTISISFTKEFVTVECWKCACVYAMTKGMNDNLKENKQTFYCPNGHSAAYGQSTSDKLRRQLKTEKEMRERERQTRDRLRDDLSASERSNTALRGAVTRKKNQFNLVKKGSCPCCKRYFTNLHRHMENKHPEFQKEVKK